MVEAVAAEARLELALEPCAEAGPLVGVPDAGRPEGQETRDAENHLRQAETDAVYQPFQCRAEIEVEQADEDVKQAIEDPADPLDHTANDVDEPRDEPRDEAADQAEPIAEVEYQLSRDVEQLGDGSDRIADQVAGLADQIHHVVPGVDQHVQRAARVCEQANGAAHRKAADGDGRLLLRSSGLRHGPADPRSPTRRRPR